MNKIALDDAHYFEDNQKLEDIKRMIDSDADSQKMEGLKRLIGMISKGRDASALFPAVVKNVISKNVELKKLVYMYLVHYAELQPDVALLAISTFQKDLGASSQWIRASALRAMSSIRVKIIVQLIVLAIQKCVKDTSPYVRKAAAHAISKVYGLDHEHKDELIEIIKILLTDRSTMVLGSTIAAWTEVCPDRFDLIHPHFRKLCGLLADVDEWGQVIILNLFIRYGRTQFQDPNKEREKKEKAKKKEPNGINWNDNDESPESENESEEESDNEDYTDIDPDHRLLLNAALPLLKNRNTAVVLAVAALYFHLAPISEAQKVSKSLIRISRGKREIQYLVLANLATMAATRPSMFEPFVAEFFVSQSDPTFCRALKLEIITYLVNQDNINKILKEFKNYVQMEDKKFVAATIQAIGRCASSVPEVTDRCLHGLMSLLSNRSEIVVAESVVVIKQLLQMLTDSEEHEATMKEVISHLAKLLETITVPSARSSIIWAIGEYSHKVPNLAPDILRKLAKEFQAEDPNVKLQILNLGSKLYLTNAEQTEKIFEYVLNLSKYDMSYDVRDRARLVKHAMFSNGKLRNYSKNLFITKKPVPTQISPSEGRQRFMIGTLSHILNQTTVGYLPLTDYPETAPPKDVRNEPVLYSDPAISTKGNQQSDFWSDGENSNSGSYSTGEESGSYTSGEEEEENSGSYTSEEEPQPPPKTKAKAPAPKVTTSAKQTPQAKKEASIEDLFGFSGIATQSPQKSQPASKNNANLMDDLFNSSPAISSPTIPSTSSNYSGFSLFSSETPRRPLLKHVVGGGLGIEYSYVRAPSMIGATVNTLQLWVKNHLQKPIKNIKLGKTTLVEGMEIHPFQPIEVLEPGVIFETQLSIKFSSVSHAAKFEICTDQGIFNITLSPNIGDLVRASALSPQEFNDIEKKLKGMNEITDSVTFKDVQSEEAQISQRVLQCAYLSIVTANIDSGKYQFSGRSMLKDEVLLFSVIVDRASGTAKCSIHSENTVLNSMLLKQLKGALVGETK